MLNKDVKMVSIIVPCYNEEQTLPLFYGEVKRVLEAAGVEYEIIFIDDGSKDNTLGVIENYAGDDSCVRFISFSRNFGKEAALLAGLKNARGEFVCVMDADMQDPPSLLTDMIPILERGEYDCVATKRITRSGEPVIRSLFARGFYKVINKISDTGIEEGARDFRLMRRDMVNAVISMPEYNRFSKGIFSWVGFKTYWIPYENTERAAGKTKWSFWKLFEYALDGIFNFSDVPLKIASLIGFLMTTFSLVAMVYIIVRKLVSGNPTPGWASTATIIFFVSGIQLFCLGVLGRYVAKIYTETKNRPHYIIAKTNITAPG